MKKEVETKNDEQVEVEVIEIPSEESKKKIDEYEQQVAVQKSPKKKMWSALFFVFNIVMVVGIVLYQVFFNEDFVGLTEISINGWYFLALIVVFLIIQYVDVLPMAYLVKKACKRSRFKLSFKATMYGRYYDAITPMSTGGEPVQITYLLSHDVPATSSLSIPMAKLFFVQLTWFFVSLVCLIISFTSDAYNTFVSIASYIGFILNFVLLFFIFFLAIAKNVGKRLVVRVLKLLQKMKIVKDYEKQYKKVTAYVEDYQNIMITYMKSPKDFIVMFVTIGVRTVLLYFLPFLVYCSLVGFEIELFGTFFIMGVLIDLAAGFFPIPGGSGMSELSISAMFAAFFPSSTLVWAMLIYRFFNYYAYLLIGLGVTLYDLFYGKRKYQWLKKQRELQAESREFRAVQIQNFRAERATRRRKTSKNN